MTALTTFLVALLLVLSIPVSQLRTVSIETSCCCPDPTKCHCPVQEGGKPGQPELRACHQTTHANIAPTLPAFAAPAVTTVISVARTIVRPTFLHSAPHGAPPPARPDAPS
ncbi:hypothetical protein BH11MYX3_BH11MYX3_11080 [soil metagenome]